MKIFITLTLITFLFSDTAFVFAAKDQQQADKAINSELVKRRFERKKQDYVELYGEQIKLIKEGMDCAQAARSSAEIDLCDAQMKGHLKRLNQELKGQRKGG